MSLCPSTVSSSGILPADYYFALKSDIAPPQVLSQNANTVSLSGGGGAVNIASTSAVALSTQKLTAVTYDTGLLETNVAGVLNVGLGSAIGSTRVEGAKIVIERTLADPQIEFVKGVNVERIKYDGTKLLMGSVGISGEIYDNFGSPGAAGQQLQSSGPGLPFVWGAGSGVGLTAVVAGTNIGVDNTNPIAPIVNVAITSTLDMSGQNIINGVDVSLKGANPSINFKNIAGTDRAFLDYTDFSDQVTLSAVGGAVAAEAVAFGSRMILDTNGAALTSTDRDVTIQRSQTGLGIRTIATLEDNGVIQIGAPGIGTNPSISLVPTTGAAASIANTATNMSMTAPTNITLTTPSVLLGGITTYDTAASVQNTVFADVNTLDQVLTNNAYVPMTNYASGIAFTINPSQTIAFDTNSMPGGQLFRWRYSGQFGPSGLGGRSRYCGALRFQVDVNIASRSWDNPDTIIWWVELNDTINGQVYQAQDFGTSGDRYGYITTSQTNPTNSEICHSVSFSSIFDLDTSVTGQPTPDDGDDCYFTVYGWGNGTTTTNRANVSVSIRPMRNLL